MRRGLHRSFSIPMAGVNVRVSVGAVVPAGTGQIDIEVLRSTVRSPKQAVLSHTVEGQNSSSFHDFPTPGVILHFAPLTGSFFSSLMR